MREPKPGEPWAMIAHKDNHWAGVRACDGDAKGIGEFVRDFVSHGFGIITVYSRDEYKKLLDGMKMWHDHPDYKPKRKRA